MNMKWAFKERITINRKALGEIRPSPSRSFPHILGLRTIVAQYIYTGSSNKTHTDIGSSTGFIQDR